jgi:hypothetical protein
MNAGDKMMPAAPATADKRIGDDRADNGHDDADHNL